MKAASLATLIAACSSMELLPQSTNIQNSGFQSYDDVSKAYDRIAPGSTPAPQLSKLGFDVARNSNVEVLNYLGVIERFMPRESITLVSLDPAVRDCISARAGCTGYIFRPSMRTDQRVGNVFLDTLSFRRTTVSSGWSAEVLLLVQNNIVTYKLLSGKPRIDGTEKKEQPLGPMQDLGGTAASVAGSRVP
jgi:hypothetical protein